MRKSGNYPYSKYRQFFTRNDGEILKVILGCFNKINSFSKLITIKAKTVGEATRSSLMMFSYGLLHMDKPVWADQQIFTCISSMQRVDAVWKIEQEWWVIGTDGERERQTDRETETERERERESRNPEISARFDDDDLHLKGKDKYKPFFRSIREKHKMPRFQFERGLLIPFIS